MLEKIFHKPYGVLSRGLLSFILVFLWAHEACAAKNVYTDLGPGKPDAYGHQVIRLALEKTQDVYGEFELLSTPEMNEARAYKSIKFDAYPHPIRVFGSTQETLNDPDIRYVEFPIFLGVYSYRVCWSPANKERQVAATESIDRLRKFTHGQVNGWSDIDILRHNGFKVVEGINLGQMYKLLSANRIDLFCRGASEPFAEAEINSRIRNISLNKNMALYYPLPHFLFTKASDVHTSELLKLGLERAFNDGSLMALWKQFFGKNFDQSELHKRRIFKLENPGIAGLDPDYLRFTLQPNGPVGPSINK